MDVEGGVEEDLGGFEQHLAQLPERLAALIVSDARAHGGCAVQVAAEDRARGGAGGEGRERARVVGGGGAGDLGCGGRGSGAGAGREARRLSTA
eukprot:2170669-Rhodomonas_salina.1